MKSKNDSTIAISSILVFALIATATTGISTSFENVLAQGENGSLQDGNMECLNIKLVKVNLPHLILKEIIKKEARGLGDADLGEVQEVTGEFIVTQKGTVRQMYLYS